MSDPFASIAKPLPQGGGVDPFASIAKQSPATAPNNQPHGAPGNAFTSGHPLETLRANYDEAARPSNASDGGVMGRGLHDLGRGFTETLAGPLIHPLDTIKGIGSTIGGMALHPDQSDPENPINKMAMSTVQDFQDNGAAKAIPHLLGQAGGGFIGGEMAGPVLGAAGKGLRAGGSALRDAAIGDPDAAALRGLQIGPKSDAQLSTLRSVEKSRPYLAGASSQADMQARLTPAMKEVWNPYSSAVDAIGDRAVPGPDGMTTVRELENERLRLSALNRGVKSGNPSDLHQAIQEGRTPAQLIEREEQVKAALDPHLESTGIKPSELRDTYGALADVRNGVEGKTTLNEKPKPSGFGRLLNVDPLKPRTFLGEPAQGIRDLAAGRPLWSAKPTDLGIREGFATGGPKPDLGTLRAPDLTEPRPLGLHAPPIELGRAPEAGGVPEGYRPPPFYHDTDAMRLGRLLHAPPIELGGEVAGPKGPPFRYDTTPMRQGNILPAPLDDVPLSSHADIFPEQRPGTARIRPKVIEGKK